MALLLCHLAAALDASAVAPTPARAPTPSVVADIVMMVIAVLALRIVPEVVAITLLFLLRPFSLHRPFHKVKQRRRELKEPRPNRGAREDGGTEPVETQDDVPARHHGVFLDNISKAQIPQQRACADVDELNHQRGNLDVVEDLRSERNF